MGLIFSRKGKSSSKETLERLEKEIKSLEARKSRNAALAKRAAVYFILLCAIGYLVGALLIFFLYKPENWKQLVFRVGPLVVFPLIGYWIRRGLRHYFGRTTENCDAQLAELRREKKEVIDRLVDEEPYKVAKELLQRFDPKSPHLEQFNEQPAAPRQQPGNSELRRRHVEPFPQAAEAGGRPLQGAMFAQREQMLLAQQQRHEQMLHQQQQIILQQQRELQSRQSAGASAENQSSPNDRPSIPVYELMPGHVAGLAPGPPKPVPILPRERSAIDKIVEFLVGDGPNNRYALICSECHSHNGMALPSEFEYCTFRCAYCYHLNPARKEKPVIHDAVPAENTPRVAAKNTERRSGQETAPPMMVTDKKAVDEVGEGNETAENEDDSNKEGSANLADKKPNEETAAPAKEVTNKIAAEEVGEGDEMAEVEESADLDEDEES